MCSASETPGERAKSAIQDMPEWIAKQPAPELGDVIIENRALIDRLEAANADAMRRFEKAGGYKTDGSLGMVPWLKVHGKLSGGAAAEHVETARQLGSLPKTEEALARGEIGYQHAVAMARTAEHVGAAAVRKAETKLLQAAQAMDPGQFVTVAKNFEHQVDRDAALEEANRAYQRRYLSIGEPVNGLARIDGQLVPEAAAIVRTAIEPYLKPRTGDERSGGQRAHDALIQALRRGMGRASGAGRASDGEANGATANGGANGSGPRPLMIIKTSVDTLAGIDGAPAGQLEWGGTVPAETVRRLACDSAITRIIGRGELEYETTHATRTIPPMTRRALVARDGHCVFPGCDRPAPWCEGHHLVFWADGGPTKIENLGLVCRAHHRMVHEEGWTLLRKNDRWIATPPALKVIPHARSA
ncbi:MAG TPA: DUF222 domain-containing protein [Candidatus Dormibacteraeota bacterium]|nr:DUF222 domain-containing protein [Candidatus Dormibacteraeota bacterium]